MDKDVVKIVERYLPKYEEYKYKTGIPYKNVNELVDTVYVLNINGKDQLNHYYTKKAAEAAVLKYDKEKHLNELQSKADKALDEMIRFKLNLSHLNKIYIYFKNGQFNEDNGFEFTREFDIDNPVLQVLPDNEKHKCYVFLMKLTLKDSINEYYKLKKKYFDIKKEINSAKQRS